MGISLSTNVKVQKRMYKRTAPFDMDSRIAIIGGGAGGLHMALELKKRGYENITVFEKGKEVGGKAFTIDVNDKCFDTGTVLTYADPLVVDLLKDVGLYKETRLFDVMNTQEYSKSSNCILSKLDITKEITGISCTPLLKLTLKSQLSRFKSIYRQMVDEYGFPKEEYISEMVKPVEQFLLDHGLQALGPLVSARLKSQGYDRGDMITFYALFFLDPTFLRPGGTILEFKSGFGWQNVWTRLVEMHKIDVEYNKHVESVELTEDQLIKLQVKDLSSDTSYTAAYDFCIFAIPNPLKLMTRPSYLQQHYLSKCKHFNPVLTTIYRSKDKHNVSLVFDNKSDYMSKHQTGVCLYRKNIKTSEPGKNENADKEEEHLSQSDHIDVAYVYFEKNYILEVDELPTHEESLFRQIKFLTNEEDIEKIHSKINNYYLPHCSPEDIEAGVPWELFRLQGENKMWFTSAITSFDLTQAIINYNIKLLDQYDI